MDAAAPLLARIAPRQQTSRSIRHGERLRTVSVTEPAMDAGVRDLVEQTADAHPGELIGVIGPSAWAARLATLLEGTDAVVVAAPDARGLEFDSVFIIDPAAIESARHGGIRDLYVALTRATKRVVIIELGAV